MPVYQGTYYSRGFLFKNSTTSDPIDITNWAFECMVRDRLDSVDALLTLTSLNGGFTVVDGPTGSALLAMTADQTALLPVGRMHFDVLRTDIVPGPTWQFGGRFPVKKPVTRDD